MTDTDPEPSAHDVDGEHLSREDVERQGQEQARRPVAYYQHRSGPLPSPADLKGYEDVLPGAAERIMQMAESESGHRRTSDKDIIRAEVGAQTRGQWLGFVLAFSGMSGGLLAAVLGSPFIGSSVSVVSLAGAFGSPWLRLLLARGQKPESDGSEQ